MDLKLEFDLDEVVYDCLTREHTKIIGINIGIGQCDKTRYHGVAIGYWLDSDYLGGGRHPWEIDHLSPRESQYEGYIPPVDNINLEGEDDGA